MNCYQLVHSMKYMGDMIDVSLPRKVDGQVLHRPSIPCSYGR